MCCFIVLYGSSRPLLCYHTNDHAIAFFNLLGISVSHQIKNGNNRLPFSSKTDCSSLVKTLRLSIHRFEVVHKREPINLQLTFFFVMSRNFCSWCLSQAFYIPAVSREEFWRTLPSFYLCCFIRAYCFFQLYGIGYIASSFHVVNGTSVLVPWRYGSLTILIEIGLLVPFCSQLLNISITGLLCKQWMKKFQQTNPVLFI